MTIHYQDDLVQLWHGDCLDVLRDLPDASVHAVVTDPPYGLEFMGKEWDRFGDGTASSHATAGVSGSAAFQAWCEQWAAECLRVLKPGGYLLAFGGTRTWHRLASAVEDAGFKIRDSIAWLYGSGFPKSLDVSKAIDKRPGVERHPEFAADLKAAMAAKGYTNTFDVAEAVIGRRTGAVANWQKYQWPEAKWWPVLRDLLDMDDAKWGPVIAEADRVRTGRHLAGLATGTSGVGASGEGKDRRDAPATPDAERWNGWGTALKPAFEPIVVARKPLQGTVAGNVLAHGTGALNIDATRVGTDVLPAQTAGQSTIGTFERGLMVTPERKGRWPANVTLDDTQAALLDQQSGTLTSGANPTRRGSDKLRDAYGDFKGQEECTPARGADSGGASRFFPTFRYEPKAPTLERPRDGHTAHPTVKPLDLMRWLVRLVTPPGGTVLDPFAGSGTTAEACVLECFRCITIEREADYLPLIVQRLSKPLQPGLGIDFGDGAA